MIDDLQFRFTALCLDLDPAPLITDVAFALPGGLSGAAAAFAGEIEADIYARPHNPTVKKLADAINRLDGGTGAVAYASGQAAVRSVIQLLTSQNTEVVLSRHLFGGTASLESGLMARFGVTFKWADAAHPATFESQITDRTRAFFIESVSNPGGEIADFKGLRAVADAHKIPLIVDNTTAPLLFAPKDHGADIIVYSATKYLNGHGNAAAGIAIDTGRFPWQSDARYAPLSASSGGVPSLADRFNGKALYKALLSQLTVDGSILAPEKAATIHQNLLSLPARLQGHIDHTLAVASYLEAHPAVEKIHYAGLADDTSHDRAKTYLPHGVAGPIMVTLKGGLPAAAHVIDRIGPQFLHAVNIGDSTKNLISHPATTTHRQLSDDQKAAIGIKPGSLRLSLSSGHPAATLESLDRVLRNAPV